MAFVTSLEEILQLKDEFRREKERFRRHRSLGDSIGIGGTGEASHGDPQAEPTSAQFQKLVLDYFSKEANATYSLPLESYDILKRLASWSGSGIAIPFTRRSLENLQSALKTLSSTWGANVILVEEVEKTGSAGTSRHVVQLETIDVNRIGVANVVESSLNSEDPASATRALKLTVSSPINLVRKRKRQSLNEVDLNAKRLEELLAKPSFKEQEETRPLEELSIMLNKKTSRDRLVIQMFRTTNNSFREFCVYGTKADCRRNRKTARACPRLHFRRMLRPHTEIELGDCSYLNTCHRMDTCKYVHYDLDEDEEEWKYVEKKAVPPSVVFSPPTKVLPPQWINCDVRKFDFSVLGKFTVIMADPPWDIHMTLPYGTMTDDEMKAMAISELQDEGLLFLWVTGRAMELGRECLAIWGYDRVDELVWIKTNQLQRLIRTGRTGHWLNHSKEHCLVGRKGNPAELNCGLDCDVLVGEVRETSRKPDEVYGLIDRLAAGTRKLEIFGRQHNTRPGWMTLGNQLEDVRVYEPDLVSRYNARYPENPCKLTPLPPDW